MAADIPVVKSEESNLEQPYLYNKAQRSASNSDGTNSAVGATAIGIIFKQEHYMVST